MKRTQLTTAAFAALALLGTATLVDARPHRIPSSHIYISGYRSCGTPIHTERYFIGYDQCGNPVWGYRTVAYRSHYRPAPRYHVPPGRHYAPPARHYGPPACAPVHRPARGGFTFSGSFRR